MSLRRFVAVMATLLVFGVLVFIYVATRGSDRSSEPDHGRVARTTTPTPSAAPPVSTAVASPAELEADDPPALPPADYKPAERRSIDPMSQATFVEHRTSGLR